MTGIGEEMLEEDKEDIWPRIVAGFLLIVCAGSGHPVQERY